MSETFWVAVGSICAAGAVFWSIFIFILQIQDKRHKEETRHFNIELSSDIHEMKQDIKLLSQDVSDIKTTQAVHMEKLTRLESGPQCKNYRPKRIKGVINKRAHS